MTLLAPAAIAFARSPGRRMPPSAISGTPVSRAAFAQSSTAVSCGTPTPATSRVVHAKPGPDSDLDGVRSGRREVARRPRPWRRCRR